jgi:hypothetical protein
MASGWQTTVGSSTTAKNLVRYDPRGVEELAKLDRHLARRIATAGVLS